MAELVAPSGEVVEVSYPKWYAECVFPSYEVEVDTGVIHMGGEPYQGEYVSTPSWETQTYETLGRTMRNNFTVNSIVKLEVDNPSGGLTLTI